MLLVFGSFSIIKPMNIANENPYQGIDDAFDQICPNLLECLFTGFQFLREEINPNIKSFLLIKIDSQNEKLD